MTENPTNSSPARMTRRKWLLGALAGAGAAMTGGYSGTFRPRLTRRGIWLPRLPEGWDGVRVLHLTDLHRGPYVSLGYLRDCVERARALPHDIVFLTGDFVSREAGGIRECGELFRTLDAPLGAWAVTGNHDHYTDPDAIAGCLEECGVRVLRNASERLTRKGDAIRLVGVDDASTRNDDLPAAGKDVQPEDFLCLLSHTPGLSWEATRRAYDLMFSGHTHGGQICLPGGKALFAANHMGPRWAAGLFRLKGLAFYVNRGLGVVMVPLRVFCPPEIAVLTLRRGKAPNGTFDDESDVLE